MKRVRSQSNQWTSARADLAWRSSNCCYKPWTSGGNRSNSYSLSSLFTLNRRLHFYIAPHTHYYELLFVFNAIVPDGTRLLQEKNTAVTDERGPSHGKRNSGRPSSGRNSNREFAASTGTEPRGIAVPALQPLKPSTDSTIWTGTVLSPNLGVRFGLYSSRHLLWGKLLTRDCQRNSFGMATRDIPRPRRGQVEITALTDSGPSHSSARICEVERSGYNVSVESMHLVNAKETGSSQNWKFPNRRWAHWRIYSHHSQPLPNYDYHSATKLYSVLRVGRLAQ